MAGVGQAERRDPEVFQAVDYAVGILVGDIELVGVVAAGGDDRGVEALGPQVVQAEVAPQGLVALELGAETPDGLVFGLEDLLLG